MKQCLFIILSFFLSLPASGANAEDTGVEFFEQHIRPLLVDNCIQCHGPDKPKNGLRLDRLESLVAGGDSGSVIDQDSPEDSLLLSAIRYEAFDMPPKEQLPNKQILAVKKWLNLGAPWPQGEVLSAAKAKPRLITDEDRQHWSFQPIAHLAPPQFEHAKEIAWCKNPIDHFVLQRLQDQLLSPAPAADRRTLIRRLFFDLLGIPPTPTEVRQFLQDDTETAYEDLVDRLLTRPEYGERWARHWLDLVRYAESDGFRQDAYRPGTWHYRDYVIQSFNEDKPYDRFLSEQLAGDELYPNDPASWVGTVFFRLQPYEYNQRDIVTQRQDILNDITDVTADVFLGMGMKCARCHDHKFDPILQEDYFRLQAHFAALLPRDNQPLATHEELADYETKRKAWEIETQAIRDQIAAIHKPYQEKQAKAAFIKFTPELRAMFEKPAQQRDPLESQLAYFIGRQTVEEGKYKLSAEDAKRVKSIEQKLEAFRSLKPKPLETTLVAFDLGNKAPATRLPNAPTDTAIPPSGMSVLSHLVPSPSPVPQENSTGRRTALVQWLTSPKHPLTSRVAVNRVWQHHFGQGLVPTTSDFGKLGTAPSHPKLLDWLATQFIRAGWQLKPLHRLMVCSATYRQSAIHPRAAQQETRDPSNRLCWRAPVRRLDAEQIVDAALSVSGELDQRVGGPSESSDTKRRAIYRKVIRNKPDRFLNLFDGADSFNSTPRRNTTTTSPQALALLNGEFGNQRAKAMAKRLQNESSSPEAQLTRGYELALSRAPTANERRLTWQYLGFANDRVASNRELTLKQLVDLCHVLLNTNEFVYVD